MVIIRYIVLYKIEVFVKIHICIVNRGSVTSILRYGRDHAAFGVNEDIQIPTKNSAL